MDPMELRAFSWCADSVGFLRPQDAWDRLLGGKAVPRAERLTFPFLAPAASWVQIMASLEGQSVGSLLDAELQGTEGLDLEEVESLVRVAMLCLNADPKERPTMSSVAKLLGNRDLAQRWAQWQEEAVNMKDVINLVRNPDLWNDMTTGVTLTDIDIHEPR